VKENDALAYTTKLRNLQHCLKTLREQDIITETRYVNLYLETWKAKSIQELQDLTGVVAAICEGKGD
jgi:ribosomal protein L19E